MESSNENSSSTKDITQENQSKKEKFDLFILKNN